MCNRFTGQFRALTLENVHLLREPLIEWEQNHQLQLTADEIEASGKFVQVNIKHLVDNNAK
jgi:hypothetical protein